MTECEEYGINRGCDEDCPVLKRHECQWVIEEIPDVFKILNEKILICQKD